MTVNGMIASFVICREKQEQTSQTYINLLEKKKKPNTELINSHLVESNRIESQAQVKKSNRDSIEHSKKHDSFCVNGFGFEEI